MCVFPLLAITCASRALSPHQPFVLCKQSCFLSTLHVRLTVQSYTASRVLLVLSQRQRLLNVVVLHQRRRRRRIPVHQSLNDDSCAFMGVHEYHRGVDKRRLCIPQSIES